MVIFQFWCKSTAFPAYMQSPFWSFFFARLHVQWNCRTFAAFFEQTYMHKKHERFLFMLCGPRKTSKYQQETPVQRKDVCSFCSWVFTRIEIS